MRQLFACIAVVLGVLVASAHADEPICVIPHPQAGKFRAQRDADKPVLAYYGGVGLRRMPNGTWNGYRQNSAEDVKLLISRLHQSGITRAYASFQEEAYPSAIAPPAETQPDYVAIFCDLAHQNNIEVYGDLACFANFEERCRGFVADHPEAFTRHRDGSADRHMLSPAYSDVRRFKRSLFMEYVSNYPVDGLALDFIRYPYYSHDLRVGFGKHGYELPALRRYQERTGSLALQVPDETDPRWIAVKADFVTQFIRELRGDLAASGVSLPLATFNSATFGREDSLRTVHQDWLTWERERLVDEHAPMILMTFGMSNLCNAVGDLVKIPDRKSIVMGPIFLDAGFDAEAGVTPTPQRIRDAARRLIKLGCDGLWFCRASEIETHNLWPVVKEISQWSISEIRRQEFDPVYENLLENGSFDAGLDGWTRAGTAQIDVGDGVTLRPDAGAPVELSQAVRFVQHPYLAVHALEMRLRGGGAAVARGAVVALSLEYVDGHTAEHVFGSADFVSNQLKQNVAVECDFQRRVLKRATVKVVVPAGTAAWQVQSVELFRDPRDR